MKSRQKQIGIDRRIRLEWLETTVRLLLAGLPEQEIVQTLLNEVGKRLSVRNSSVKRGSGEKAVTNLMKIWVRSSQNVQPLRDTGVSLFELITNDLHIVLHWGMTMAVYPFWGNVASQTGRLLRLQGTVTPDQVQRRIKEQYGERPTVKDATRRALRSMHDWGVLTDTSKRSVYIPGPTISIENRQLIAWLIEAFLHTRDKPSGTITGILSSPIFFPFHFGMITQADLSHSNRLDVIQHGLDEKLIMLRDTSKS